MNTAWEEPDYEPVSPNVVGSNPIPAYAWECDGAAINNRGHGVPWFSQGEPPFKRTKFSHADLDPNENLSPLPGTIQPAGVPMAAHVLRPRPAGGNFLQKTKLCTRFEAGTCTFNANCNFAHGLEELRKPPPQLHPLRGSNPGPVGLPGPPRFMKTRTCKFFREGNCPYADRCNFLHDGEQGQGQGPRPGGRPPSWKTKLCMNWEGAQHCNFGDSCNFAHGLAELQKYGGGTFNAESGVAVQRDMTHPDNLITPYTDPTTFDYINTHLSYGLEGSNPRSGFTSSGASMPTVPFNPNDNTYQETRTPAYQNPEGIRAISPYNGYTSPTNEWDKAGLAARSEANSIQMYGEATRQGSWVSHYQSNCTNCTNSQGEEEPCSSTYSENQLHPKDNVGFLRSSTRHDYQQEGSLGFRRYVNSDSVLSRNGNDDLHGMQDKNNYIAQGPGYADQYNEPYNWSREM
uniref:C3H1-type domain-containing protein n=1 Tax=Araucaria cunninghamii TaxID=56994 RepID=A0A0D6R1T4_ARACU